MWQPKRTRQQDRLILNLKDIWFCVDETEDDFQGLVKFVLISNIKETKWLCILQTFNTFYNLRILV